MAEWLIWLILAVVLVIAEIFTLTAALGLLGVSALLTAGTAALGLPLPVQLIVFAATSTAGVALLRPFAIRHMAQPQITPFGIEALVGKPAVVTQEVTEMDGRVRISGEEEWSARSYDASVVIPVGTVVDVMEISGSTALVYPREGPWKSPPL